jgi:hypothetical protein
LTAGVGLARRWTALRVVVALASGASACARPAVAPTEPTYGEVETTIDLHGYRLAVRLARPAGRPPGGPVLVYATGDSGWHRLALELYRKMAGWGYPVVGFSAKDYVRHIGFVSGTTTPERLAADYRRLIDFAREAFGLPPATPAVLVGLSRGSGLSVVAAGRPEVQAELAGVLAVALTREEEYVRHYRVKPGKTPADMPKRELVTFDTYGSLEDLQAVPLVVIQSTRDSYLAAADARELFGPDTDRRKLLAIDARNHNFDGAREMLFSSVRSSLESIAGSPTAAGGEAGRRP